MYHYSIILLIGELMQIKRYFTLRPLANVTNSKKSFVIVCYS